MKTGNDLVAEQVRYSTCFCYLPNCANQHNFATLQRIAVLLPDSSIGCIDSFLSLHGYGRHDDMETLLDEVEKKRYTMIASGCLFQFPPCRDSVSFTGTVKETGENFFYRIYDRELFLHIMHRLRAVKREKTPAKAKAILLKCKRYE